MARDEDIYRSSRQELHRKRYDSGRLAISGAYKKISALHERRRTSEGIEREECGLSCGFFCQKLGFRFVLSVFNTACLRKSRGSNSSEQRHSHGNGSSSDRRHEGDKCYSEELERGHATLGSTFWTSFETPQACSPPLAPPTYIYYQVIYIATHMVVYTHGHTHVKAKKPPLPAPVYTEKSRDLMSSDGGASRSIR